MVFLVWHEERTDCRIRAELDRRGRAWWRDGETCRTAESGRPTEVRRLLLALRARGGHGCGRRAWNQLHGERSARREIRREALTGSAQRRKTDRAAGEDGNEACIRI